MLSNSINQYIESITEDQDELLKDIDRTTHLRTTQPRMLSGKVQGKFLEIISGMMSPTRILEIGSFTGYSAICLARGLKPSGLLYTIEANEEIIPMLKNNILKAGMNNKVQIITGDAIEEIPKINETFDFVFIDGDKRQYIDYYKAVLPKTRQGGIILVDNILWSGKVVENPKDKESVSILNFNKMVLNDPKVEQVALSIRDGLLMIRKRQS